MSRREIRNGHYVLTADGTLCHVSHVTTSTDGTYAHLWPDDGGAPLDLPVSELKRVPNPRRQLPPIQGLPAERPVCQWCQKPFRPLSNSTYNGKHPSRVIRRQFTQWNSYRGLFCTLRCTLQFATAAHVGGYRRVK